MCGIFGLVSARADNGAESAVERGLREISHRGPDASASRVLDSTAAHCVLGAVRLRIIDLSTEADQPLGNEDGSIWAVYNGELYNHVELRHELMLDGHEFRTQTDGEVLTHLYEACNGNLPAMLGRLRGMFAFALFDTRRSRLVVARDRLGIKPLYWSSHDGSVAFSSEVRALARAGLAPGSLDDEALLDYMVWGTVQRPRTIFRGVSELSPGSYIDIDRGGPPREVRWWQPKLEPFEWTRDDARALFTAAFDDAVSRHLVADRPVGLFLSAGVDSGAIADAACRGGSDLRTLTVTFPDAAGDEGAEARATADRLGASHAEVPVTGAEVGAQLDEMLRAMDQPTSDGVNTWLVSRAAKQVGLTVVLSGLGGDELFRGYPSFGYVPKVRMLSRVGRVVPAPARDLLVGAIEARRPGHAAARVVSARGSYVDAYAAVRGLYPEAVHRIPADARTGLDGVDDPRDAVMILELGQYLANQLLRDTDQMSMSHSLEARVPWLDDSVVRAALALPAALRDRATIVGAELASRPKVGFSLPFGSWLRGPLNEVVKEGLFSSALPFGDLIPAERRHQVWQAFVDGKTHWSRPWAIAVIRLWPAANGFSGA